MSNRYIPANIKAVLMGMCGGKCEFRGCEENVLAESLTKKSGIYSNFAHIIADSENGPRGDKELSLKLAKDKENIMVLCFKHHKLIDENEEEYTVEVLKQMKSEHEKYISELMKVHKCNKVMAIKYTSSISDRIPTINDIEILSSITKQNMYCIGDIIDLRGNTYIEKNDENFFRIESQNLKESFQQCIKPLQKKEKNLPIFLYAIAPQPLLIYLGSLFSDISNIEVQQLQREPKNEWLLSEIENKDFEIFLTIPEKKFSKVALNISITANIDNKRIREALGEECDIIKLESNIHGNDIIKSKNQLEKYRKKIRQAFERIKDIYGRNCEINIFPATPVSIAIETGRCWMKKAQPNLIIFDEKNGFKKTLEIKSEGGE